MANLKVKDAEGNIKELKVNGAGTAGDPFIPVNAEGVEESIVKAHEVSNPTAGSEFWQPANGKKVLINSICMTFAASTSADDGKAKLQALIGSSWVDLIVLTAKKNTNEVVSHAFHHHVATDAGTGSNNVLRIVVTGAGTGQETTVTVEGEEV